MIEAFLTALVIAFLMVITVQMFFSVGPIWLLVLIGVICVLGRGRF